MDWRGAFQFIYSRIPIAYPYTYMFVCCRCRRTKTETPDKRTSAQFQLIYKACRFCSFFSTDLGTNCRKNTGSREMCMRAYGFYVQNTIEQKSQSKWWPLRYTTKFVLSIWKLLHVTNCLHVRTDQRAVFSDRRWFCRQAKRISTKSPTLVEHHIMESKVPIGWPIYSDLTYQNNIRTCPFIKERPIVMDRLQVFPELRFRDIELGRLYTHTKLQAPPIDFVAPTVQRSKHISV